MDFSINKVKLIVGLGNIGSDYAKTRHNAGFMFAELFAKSVDPRVQWKSDAKFKADYLSLTLQGNAISVLKPTTMMNNSGEAVQAFSHFYKIQPDEILVAHDDLDIPLGSSKLQFDKGPKVHNGILSIDQKLGTSGFWRLRLGIENREVKGNAGIPGMKYALQRFGVQEMDVLQSALAEAMEDLMNK